MRQPPTSPGSIPGSHSVATDLSVTAYQRRLERQFPQHSGAIARLLQHLLTRGRQRYPWSTAELAYHSGLLHSDAILPVLRQLVADDVLCAVQLLLGPQGTVVARLTAAAPEAPLPKLMADDLRAWRGYRLSATATARWLDRTS